MSSLRLKIQLGDAQQSLKFVYVLDSPSSRTVAELIRSLEEHIRRQFCRPHLRLVRLTTHDGYLLSSTDRCHSVLKDNDCLLCVDMGKFSREVNPSLDEDNLWLDMKQHDASDDEEKYLQVGLTHTGLLFLRIKGSRAIYAIYLFSIHELLDIAKDKQRDPLIARYDQNDTGDSSNWFIEARWSPGEDLSLIGQLKIATSEEICVNQLSLHLDAARLRITRGETKVLSSILADSSVLTAEQLTRLQVLAKSLPPSKRTGPEIALSRTSSARLSKYECEGDSSVRLSTGSSNVVQACQCQLGVEEFAIRQELTITHLVLSKKQLILPEILQQKRAGPVDKPVSVLEVAVLYQLHDGSWRECQEVMIAPIAIRNEQPRWLADKIVHVEPDKLTSITVQGWLQVKGDLGRDSELRERVHKNLPQPFKLKVIITDNFGKQASLIIEQLNTPLRLPTRETFVSSYHLAAAQMLGFVSADDCEADERIYVAMFIDREGHLNIRNISAFSLSITRATLRTMEYNARQKQSPEYFLERMHYENHGQTCKAYALFDPETWLFYAVRAELSTKTSRTEETIFVPIEKLE